MSVEIVYGTPVLFNFTVESENDFANITDVLIMFKKDPNDIDADAVFTKQYTVDVGDITLADPIISVQLASSDFGPDLIEPNEKYLICIGVEYLSTGDFIEDYDPNFENVVKVLPDKIRA